MEVFGSPDYAKKSVVKGAGISDEYVRRKDSSETFQLAYTAGLRLTKTLGENIVLKAGLQYSQINEKFSFRKENERRLTTVITIRTIIRSPGDTVLVRDTSTREQIGYSLTTAYNRYRSIDVPLMVGYEWGNGRLRVGLNAGLILNLYSWQQGQTLDTSFSAVSFSKMAGQQVFKKNIGLGLYTSFSLLTRISNNVDVFAEPYFRYNVSNMTREKNPFTQKFNLAGLTFGIRYQLSKNSMFSSQR